MQLHFENIIWLSRAWPDMYYYEQSFMNYYFVFNDLTKPLVDDNGNQLITISSNSSNVVISELNSENSRKIYEFITSQGANAKKLISVTGATKSSFSTDSINQIAEMLESQASHEPPETKIHNDSTVVLHFASVRPSGRVKKTFITNYINAHKLHI